MKLAVLEKCVLYCACCFCCKNGKFCCTQKAGSSDAAGEFRCTWTWTGTPCSQAFGLRALFECATKRFISFLLIRSIKTLWARMDAHVKNAEQIARLLEEHEAISRVYYPGLPDAQGYEINRRQVQNGGAGSHLNWRTATITANFLLG